MNYMRNDPSMYAREIANQIGGTLYYTGSINDLELPNPNNFRDGDVVIHFDGIYAKIHGDWTKLADSSGSVYSFDNEYEPKYEEETDTAPWLALLED